MTRLVKGAASLSRCLYDLSDSHFGGTTKGKGRRFIKRRLARLRRRAPIEHD